MAAGLHDRKLSVLCIFGSRLGIKRRLTHCASPLKPLATIRHECPLGVATVSFRHLAAAVALLKQMQQCSIFSELDRRMNAVNLSDVLSKAVYYTVV